MKTEFNKQFEEVYRAKEVEMKRIEERNVRIRKIIKDLEIEEQVFDPKWTTEEKPELLLTVDDEEVTVEKYISEEERARLEEEERLEEGRKFLRLFQVFPSSTVRFWRIATSQRAKTSKSIKSSLPQEIVGSFHPRMSCCSSACLLPIVQMLLIQWFFFCLLSRFRHLLVNTYTAFTPKVKLS